MREKNQLSVAILTEDVSKAHELTNIFRKVGVVACFYDCLKEFWKDSLINTPDLSVVDVKKMSQGELYLKDHPLIKKEDLPVCFYYTSEVKPLLYSTYDLFHLGYICEDNPLSGQVKAILKRVNFIRKIEHHESLMNEKVSLRDRQMEQMVARVEETKQKSFYDDMLDDLIAQFERHKTSADFFTALSKTLYSWNVAKKFSFLELSFNGHKLISPKSISKKFKEIPSLWLGKTCESGIAFFAQNMASQVILDLLGGDVISLAVEGASKDPEALIYLKVTDQDFLSHFPWEKLERYISGLHNYFAIKELRTAETEDQVLSSWNLMSLLDEYRYGKVAGKGEMGKENIALIDLDFSSLIDTVVNRKQGRFFWASFYQDFFAVLSRKEISFSIVSMGMKHFALVVENEGLDRTFTVVKNHALRFSYWKYFENLDLVMTENLKPAVKMVPLSSEAYIKMTEGKVQDTKVKVTGESLPSAKKSDFVFVPGSEQTM